MDKNVAELMASIADDLGMEGVTLYRDYSGRGMYGERTTGIVVPHWSVIMRMTFELGYRCADIDNTGHKDSDSVSISKQLGDLVSDSMGRDSIIVY